MGTGQTALPLPPVSQVMKGNWLFTHRAMCVKWQFGFLTWETGHSPPHPSAQAAPTETMLSGGG